ncbi:MAG: disulfide bond formation protein B [Pseudomonadota bacterium]
MSLPNTRLLNLAGLLACAGLMGYALYAQHMLFLDPCPLCSFQRIAVIVLGVVFAVATVHNPRGIGGRRVYAALVALVTLVGAGIAGWHIRLQNLPPDEVPACGPGLSYIMQNNALGDALRMVFGGSGECADVDWQLLGLSMPAWVLIAMLGLGLFGVGNNLRRQS